MSLRWRKNGDLLCAAKCAPEEGDTYINDRLHYQLAVVEEVIIADPDEKITGKWQWKTKDI